eukprot:NODE_5243_length_680_cov_12.316456_g5080_i0.p1 GENE.NODE_5243_length_680_cov_12.316456_g5080_i0~~NODE_5243_length_680_cov_12.316456_g5080_i0.p1  ORF type:complete len:159 (+),score=13.22 NODE_5243_length_680_cov_12.316456_g5080_i0:60-536(+)
MAPPRAGSRVLCNKHLFKRNSKFLVETSPGVFACTPESVCKPKTEGEEIVSCSTHMHLRSTRFLSRQADGTYVCTPGNVCKSVPPKKTKKSREQGKRAPREKPQELSAANDSKTQNRAPAKTHKPSEAAKEEPKKRQAASSAAPKSQPPKKASKKDKK